MNCLINGQFASHVDVRDRGLAYGDGVFRTMRCMAGRVLAWPAHYAKLHEDCARLGLLCPSQALLEEEILQLDPHEATIKITITRGLSERGYACAAQTVPTRIVQWGPLPNYPENLYQSGVNLCLCEWPLSTSTALAGVKHLNRLDQVMARREWEDASIFDGLMRNARGEVVEGVISNLFIWLDGALQTHPLHDCGVAGVMRAQLLQLAQQQGLLVKEQPFDVDCLYRAEAVMVSNSLIGLLPVAAIESRLWSDFDLTKRLAAALTVRLVGGGQP